MKPIRSMGRGRRLRGRGLKVRSLSRILPNMVTLLALCAGLSSIRFALMDNFSWAAAAIVLAAFLDNLDGRVARLLSGDSRFGVELDSLSDFVSFGVAPVLVIYLWSWDGRTGFAWALVTFYVICASLRLARFNTRAEEDIPAWPRIYFMGLSSPAAAGVVLLPLMIDIEFGLEIAQLPFISGGAALFAAVMMVTRVPTYSLKGIKVPPRVVALIVLAMSLFVVMLVTQFWLAMIMLVACYITSIPLAIWSQHRLSVVLSDADQGS